MANEIARTIAEQIGNLAFSMMGTPRKSLLAHDNGLQFDIKGTTKCNRIIVRLDPSDTYTVEFWKGRGLNMRKVSESSDVYVDSLKTTIEMNTGLYLKF